MPGFTGVGGANASNYAEDNKNYGLYGANYTRWLDDRLTTLFGYRVSNTFSRRANTVATGTQGWTDVTKENQSYNLGLNYRLKPWLYLLQYRPDLRSRQRRQRCLRQSAQGHRGL